MGGRPSKASKPSVRPSALPQPSDLSSRRAVVTGASSGIGFEVSRMLASKGAQVVMLHRNPERASYARKQLYENTVPRYPVECVTADYTRLHQVAEAADYIRDKYPSHIDIVINCAATLGNDAAGKASRATEDGLDAVLQVNHIAPYLLTQRLWPALQSTARSNLAEVWEELQALDDTVSEIPGDPTEDEGEQGTDGEGDTHRLAEHIRERTVRVVNLTDALSQTRAFLTEEDLDFQHGSAAPSSRLGMKTYMNTKLMNTMTTEILCQRHPLKNGVLSHSITLPPTATSLYRHTPTVFRGARSLMAQPAANSAADVVAVATANAFGAANGIHAGGDVIPTFETSTLRQLERETEQLLHRIDSNFLKIQE